MLFCSPQGFWSNNAGCCCCSSDPAECFLQPGLSVCPSVQTRPEPDPAPERQQRSEWRDRAEAEEAAAHRVHPHRRPGVFY